MALVVDTNVWVVAGGRTGVGEECASACRATLGDLARNGILAVDPDSRILKEYWDNIPPGTLPDIVLRELIKKADRVDYRRCVWDADGNAIVPDCLAALDPSDRKFAAVALTYTPPAPIVNATDTDWQECSAGVRKAGLQVTELCPEVLAGESKRNDC